MTFNPDINTTTKCYCGHTWEHHRWTTFNMQVDTKGVTEEHKTVCLACNKQVPHHTEMP